MENGEDQKKESMVARLNGWAENNFRRSVFIAFYWIMFGVCVIYGIRLYHDIPVHPSFMPIIIVSFSVVTAFIVVLTLNSVVGEIKFKAPGFEFEGASGPIVLWIICFLALALILSSMVEKLGSYDPSDYVGKSTGDIVLDSFNKSDSD